MDRVQVVKTESAANGGDGADEVEFYTPIEPQEDAMEAAGLYLQDATHRDQTTLISRANNDLTFKDGNNPAPVTLSTLLAGGGITATQHKALRHLIHFIDDGPAEGFASGAYREILPFAGPFPTSYVWWTSAAKTAKIVELSITYNVNKTPSTEQWKMYDTDGSTVLATVTDAITYSGVFETSRTRTIA
jgi:hypothetical protein